MEQFNLLEGGGSFSDPTIQSVRTTQAKDGGKQTGCEEKKAAVHEEIKRVNQLPAHSSYATHRMRVLNKILQLLSVQVFDKINSGEVGSETVSTSGVAPYVKGSYVASGSHLYIEKWNGDGDFGKWQRKMKAVLRRNRVHNVVFDLEDLDPDVSAIEKEEMEEWALTTLQLAMGENVNYEVSAETTAKGIWTKLEELYLKKSLTNRLILLKTFFTYKMKEGSSIKTHLTVFNNLIMKMKAVDLKIEEEQMAMILLCSLPKRYTGFANSLMYGRRDTITLADVKTSLFSEELRDQMKSLSDESNDSSSSQDLFVGRGCSDEKKENSRGRSNSRKPSWRSKSRARGACHYCKKPDHWLKDCPKLKKKAEKESNSLVETQVRR